jgi:F-type H+-transporting ATPase subunit delta
MAEKFETESRAGEEGTAAVRIARVYADALLDVAEERNESAEVAEELDALATAVKDSPEIARAFASPVVKRSAKEKLIEDAFKGKISDLTFNFLRVLNSKDRLELVRQVARAYRDLLDQRAKRLRIKVRAAVALSESQTEQLRQLIAKATGLDPVISVSIDPELLGGMIVQIGDQVFDSSVRTRIDSIRNQLLARSSYEVQTGRDRFSSSA